MKLVFTVGSTIMSLKLQYKIRSCLILFRVYCEASHLYFLANRKIIILITTLWHLNSLAFQLNLITFRFCCRPFLEIYFF